MTCRGVLEVVFKTPEMHIPPWYWFRAFRPWQQLEGVRLEPYGVVPGHSPAVLEAQDVKGGQFTGREFVQTL